MTKYVVTMNGKPHTWTDSRDAALLCLQAICNAVARDVALAIVEVTNAEEYSNFKAA